MARKRLPASRAAIGSTAAAMSSGSGGSEPAGGTGGGGMTRRRTAPFRPFAGKKSSIEWPDPVVLGVGMSSG
jgi:hypothetical protein